MTIQDYINENLPKCIRINREDDGTLIGLPYPYIVPCASGMFQEMYYWDTYFTNRGLLVRGDIEQAQNNIDNMCYLIHRYGFMPNGNRTVYLSDSQPPFLALMVSDLYAVTGDKEWLVSAYEALVQEHAFWQENRQMENGLNRYDCIQNENYYVTFEPGGLRYRVGPELVIEDDEEERRGMVSAGESGWDLTPRMGAYTYHYTPADLNSLLYALEERLSFFAAELNEPEESTAWKRLSEERAEMCRRYLKSEDGLFMDYNAVTEQQSSLLSVAAFYPLFCGMATEEEAACALAALPRLETAYGIVTCEKNDVPGNYQWDYPNGWAPMHLIVVDGLLRYGYREAALRVARKYVDLVEVCYEQTGHLWEKYNVVEGSVNALNEYAMPAMLGWTFGVYTYLKDLLDKEKKR